MQLTSSQFLFCLASLISQYSLIINIDFTRLNPLVVSFLGYQCLVMLSKLLWRIASCKVTLDILKAFDRDYQKALTTRLLSFDFPVISLVGPFLSLLIDQTFRLSLSLLIILMILSYLSFFLFSCDLFN